MKKILLIHHWGGLGGAGLSLLHIIRAIDNERYQVYVLCPQYPNEMIKALKNENCVIIPIDKPPTIFNHYNGGIKHAFSFKTIKNLMNIFMDKKRITNYINNVCPDILIVNSMTLFWVGKIAKKMGLSTICFHRETYQKGLFGFRTKVIKHGLSKWFDKVAFISKYDLEKTGDTQADKQLIYDRVDFNSYQLYTSQEARDILNLDSNNKYVLFLGGFSPLKGAEVIINAMKYINNEKVKLLFIGDVEAINDLVTKDSESVKNRLRSLFGFNTRVNIYKIIKKNNLENKVIFKKRSIHPELFYKSCNLIVFPSTLAHQSRPVYEAGIARIPIIITEFEETNEFAENGITAITFKNKDAKELATKIETVIDEKIDVDEVVENNYQQSIINHDLTYLKNDLEKLLNID